MSSAVLKFVPRGVVEPTSRLEEFIRLARYELDALIPSEDWDLPSWNVGGSFRTKGQNMENRYLHYYRAGSRANRDGTVDGVVLAPPTSTSPRPTAATRMRPRLCSSRAKANG